MVTPTPPAAGRPRGPTLHENVPPLRVLLVEDDEDDYLLTRDLLREIGPGRFLLDWAATYEDAVTAVARQEHDVYLVDYRLGQHDGLELLRQPPLQNKPVIMLTGLDDPDMDIRAMKAGAADYLVKGRIDPPMLERAIRYAVERKRTEAELRRWQAELETRVQERTTELTRTNAELHKEIAQRRQAEEALREADRRKDEFLAMLAHELRNPLTPLRNGLHILRLAKEQGVPAEQALAIMEKQVHHLARLVDDLLDVSRITRGQIQLRKEPIELGVAVQQAVESVRPFIEARQHTLNVLLPDEPVGLEADPTRLEQVLINLLTNAAKYTPPGGHITLTAERNADRVALRVTDTGVGLSADLLPHVFDLFTQAERTLDRSEGGLGIGLTMVKKLVELHGGRVEAHSPGLGQGSVFVVWLPALPRRPFQEPVATSSPGRVGSSRRVLVVEDVPATAATFVLLLQAWAYDARAVHDGPAALVAYRTYQPDVVLCDIGLPGMSGYDVARALRQEAGARRPLLVAVTGYTSEEDRQRSHKAGFDFHMAKPVDPAVLEKLLAGFAPPLPA